MTLLPIADVVEYAEDTRHRAPTAGAGSRRPAPGGAGPPVPLPPAETLDGRRTVRDFTERPVAEDRVRALLATAFATHRRVRPVPAEEQEYAVIVVRRSPGGPPRASFATPAETQPLTDGLWLPLLADHYTDAPVLFLVCGTARGARADYPRHLVGAGALTHALWLAALSAGLGGWVFGRSCHRATVAAGRQQAGRRHLLTLAVGYPKETVT